MQVGWLKVSNYHACIWFCFTHAARSTTPAGAITKAVIAAAIGQNVGVLLHFGSTSAEVGNDAIGCSMTVIRQSALPLILTGVASFAQHISCFNTLQTLQVGTDCTTHLSTGMARSQSSKASSPVPLGLLASAGPNRLLKYRQPAKSLP